VLERGAARIERASGTADATLSADPRTWTAIADDVRGGMRAYQSGRLTVRRNLHLGVGFLAATSRLSGPGRLRFRTVITRRARFVYAGSRCRPTGTRDSWARRYQGIVPATVDALADHFRVIAVDLPGFGDSDKPIGAPYDPRFFADAIVDLLDALGSTAPT